MRVGVPGGPGVPAVTNPPRSRSARPSAAALKQARYRERLRDGVAVVPVPITQPIVDLVRVHLPPREFATRAEIGAAIAAFLDRLARSDK
jgi:hypothetical protein